MFPKLRAQVVGNPVTGEAYLLLDVPANPPPPIALGVHADRPYVPSMPSPLASCRTGCRRCWSARRRRCRRSGRSWRRIPDSLDRSDRFFTNVERIFTRERAAAA